MKPSSQRDDVKDLKRRFGISIPSDLAEAIDTLAHRLGVDRSTLITDMLKEALHQRHRAQEPHQCSGALLVQSNVKNVENLSEIYERYREVIEARLHHHSDDRCIDIIIIKGSSKPVLEFEALLNKLKSVKARYLLLE